MPKKFDHLLIIGLDGLDYQKIQEYECENLKQQSFGKLDLEGIELKTPKLWASLVTGKKPKEHGIETMLTFKGEKVRKIDSYIKRFFQLFGRNALHLRKYLHYQIFDSGVMAPDKRHMNVDSVFEKVANSKALEVPGYTEYPYVTGRIGVVKLFRKRSPLTRERVLRDIEAEFEYRKKCLFEAMGEHTLLMQHFHYPDWYQHAFVDGSKDESLFREMNDFAAEIQKKVDDDTLLLFCSDHGLDEGMHRDQAFYSTNADIGDNVTITNLIEKCLEHVKHKKEEETIEGIEI